MKKLLIHNVVPGDLIHIIDKRTNRIIHTKQIEVNSKHSGHCLICKVHIYGDYDEVTVVVIGSNDYAFQIDAVLMDEGVADCHTDCYVAGRGDALFDDIVAPSDYVESSLCLEMQELAKYYDLL
jgi:hypothetical protein